MGEININKTDLDTIVGSEENTRGYLFLFNVDSSLYSVGTVETAKEAESFMDKWGDDDRFIRDAIMLPNPKLIVVPYHHYTDREQLDTNFEESIAMKEKSENLFKYFCYVNAKKDKDKDKVLLFEPVHNGGGYCTDFAKFQVYDNKGLSPQLLEKLTQEREYLVRQLSLMRGAQTE